MKINDIHYDMYVDWKLTNSCNFNCVYCINDAHTQRTPKEIDIDKTVKRLNKFNKTFLINLNGGEPFLIPNFTELVYELTKKHFVTINTNLSLRKECEKFLEVIDPKRVPQIVFSTHVLERERRNETLLDLCKLVKKFQKKGFNMVGNYVLYPPLLKRLKEDINSFNKRGIPINLGLFRGNFKGRYYPICNKLLTYNKEEIFLINNIDPTRLKIKKAMNIKCNAGSTAFWIDDKLEVFPCYFINKKIGDLFDEEWDTFSKVIRCPQEYCFCQLNDPLDERSKNEFYLLNKTINENGIYSVLESYIVTRKISLMSNMDQNIGKCGILLKNNFPRIYHLLKRVI